jgi:hypothetical protein
VGTAASAKTWLSSPRAAGVPHVGQQLGGTLGGPVGGDLVVQGGEGVDQARSGRPDGGGSASTVCTRSISRLGRTMPASTSCTRCPTAGRARRPRRGADGVVGATAAERCSPPPSTSTCRRRSSTSSTAGPQRRDPARTRSSRSLIVARSCSSGIRATAGQGREATVAGRRRGRAQPSPARGVSPDESPTTVETASARPRTATTSTVHADHLARRRAAGSGRRWAGPPAGRSGPAQGVRLRARPAPGSARLPPPIGRSVIVHEQGQLPHHPSCARPADDAARGSGRAATDGTAARRAPP